MLEFFRNIWRAQANARELAFAKEQNRQIVQFATDGAITTGASFSMCSAKIASTNFDYGTRVAIQTLADCGLLSTTEARAAKLRFGDKTVPAGILSSSPEMRTFLINLEAHLLRMNNKRMSEQLAQFNVQIANVLHYRDILEKGE